MHTHMHICIHTCTHTSHMHRHTHMHTHITHILCPHCTHISHHICITLTHTVTYFLFLPVVSCIVYVDETTPQVVRVTVTDEGQVLEEHTNGWHSWGGNGTKTIPVLLVVVQKMKFNHSCCLQFSGYLPLDQEVSPFP